MTFELLVIFGCLMLSAFFSGMEIAFVSSNRVRLALQIKQPGLVSTALAIITENPSKFIATTLGYEKEKARKWKLYGFWRQKDLKPHGN